MTVPDFQAVLLPLLKLTASRTELSTRDAYEAIAKEFGLSAEDRETPMPSGGGSLFRNRVGWAKQYLMYARLVEPVRRGVSRVTDLGRKWASERNDPLKIRDFEIIPGYVDRVHGTEENKETPSGAPEARKAPVTLSIATPDERMETAHQELRQSVVAALLDRIRQRPSAFFERLVIELMSKLGYGDGSAESMLHTGKTNDGGIDGKIKMDVLGLEHIFLQAKRYDAGNPISREQVAAFAGSIAGAKGVFVTTSAFSKQAVEFVRNSHKNMVLIDGQKLGELMMRSSLGVSVKKSYQVYATDEEFFEDDE